jgi:putative endonuclease
MDWVAGESLAASYLAGLGYEIITRNFHTAHGELDIVALDKNELVIAEVKARTGNHKITAESSITTSKKRKLTLSTQTFLSQNIEFSDISVRFDVLIINYNRYDETYRIKHIINAFYPLQTGE